MGGLNLYDFSARSHDPTLGRFTTVDPLAEKYYSWSPYVYCLNNPVIFVDKNGLWPTKNAVDRGRVGNRGFSLTPVMNPYHKVKRAHKGQDFPVPEGNDIHALAEGVVSRIGYDKNGWGYYIEISHSDGYTSRYAHLKNGSIKVRKDDKVTNGEVVGLSGMTGGATGPHLHLEILLNGKPVNPMLIADLQELLYEEDGIPIIELPEVIIIGKSLHKETSLEERIDDMLWLSVRPNAYGNTGRHNKPDRASDQYYSDEFLKWYYNYDTRKENR